jgi:photosystem II stability/assembly factor-like uncharacterized protein
MRTTSKFLLALLLNLAIIQFCPAQWQTFQSSFSTNFIDVSIVNKNVIWACGYYPQPAIIRSIDGGVNWTNTLNDSTVTRPWHITAVDNNKAWVTGGQYGMYVFVTTNAGTNWFQQNYSPVEYIDFIHFFNSNTGILLTDKVNDTIGFFITRNGGSNWYRSVNSPRITTLINDNCMGFLDTNMLWFINTNRFYKLTGGLNNVWTAYDMGFYPYNIDFKDLNAGLATDGYTMKKTTNGGLNWMILTDTVLGQGSNDLQIVPFSNMTVVTSNGRIRISYDLCSSWETIQYFSHGYFIDATDTNNIWLAGDGGKMHKYNFDYIGIIHNKQNIPCKFKLYQNFPDPFNPITSINYDIMENTSVIFTIYDVSGRVMISMTDHKQAGSYSFIFDGTKYSSGIYFYRLAAGNNAETRKMVLLK